MIDISRDEATVTITIESGLSSVPNVVFKYLSSSNMCAELLARQLRDKLGARVEGIRESEYIAGYKAGRSKTAKRKYFYWSLEDKAY